MKQEWDDAYMENLFSETELEDAGFSREVVTRIERLQSGRKLLAACALVSGAGLLFLCTHVFFSQLEMVTSEAFAWTAPAVLFLLAIFAFVLLDAELGPGPKLKCVIRPPS